MAKRRRLMPELELPAIISAALSEYVGPRRLAKLSQLQRAQLARAAQDFGSTVAEILDPEGSPLLNGARARAIGEDRARGRLRVEDLELTITGEETPEEIAAAVRRARAAARRGVNRATPDPAGADPEPATSAENTERPPRA